MRHCIVTARRETGVVDVHALAADGLFVVFITSFRHVGSVALLLIRATSVLHDYLFPSLV